MVENKIKCYTFMGNWGYYFSEFHNCITLGPTLWEDGGLEEAAGHGILTGNLCA